MTFETSDNDSPTELPDQITVPQLIRQLKSEDASKRRQAVRVVATVAEESAEQLTLVVPALVPLLDDDDPAVRRRTAQTILRVADQSPEDAKPVADDLVARLNDPEHDELVEIHVQTLAHLAEYYPETVESAAPALIQLLGAERPARLPATEAVVELAKAAPPAVTSAVPHLRSLLDAENSVVQANAVWALTYLSEAFPQKDALEDALARLIPLLNSDDHSLRRQVTAAFAHLAEAQPALVVPVTDRLVDRLEDDQWIRGDASLALARVAEVDPTAVSHAAESLEDLLEADQQWIRGSAALTLAWVGREHPAEVQSMIPALAGLLDDEYNFVRGNAALGLAHLARICPDDIWPELPTLIALRDDVYFVRSNAILALAQITEEETSSTTLLSEIEISSSPIRTFTGEKNNIPATSVLAQLPESTATKIEPVPSTLIRELAECRGRTDPVSIRDALATVADEFLDEEFPREMTPVAEVLVEMCESTEVRTLPPVVCTVLAAIAGERPAVVGPVIPELVPSLEDEERREAVSRTIARVAKIEPRRIVSAGVITPLIDLLDTRESKVRRNASAALAHIADEMPEAVIDAVPALSDQLKDGDPQLRTNAALTLGYIAVTEVEPLLPSTEQFIELLDDERASGPAIGALAYIAETDPARVKPAIGQITELLDAEAEYVRGNAAWTLAYLATAYPNEVRPAVPKLAPLLDDGPVRDPALEVIANVGDTHPEALIPILPILADLLGSAEPSVRRRTREIIERADNSVVRAFVAEYGPEPNVGAGLEDRPLTEDGAQCDSDR